MIEDKALLLFSGGQDSTTLLAWALDHYEYVETLGFDYGQRHAVELDCRQTILKKIGDVKPQWIQRLGKDYCLRLDVFQQLGPDALTSDRPLTHEPGDLPSTFVPGRNLLFLSLAAARAYHSGISVLVGGMCQTDFSGYPDCRDDTMRALQTALSLGLDRPIRIETPLMWLTKAQTWQLAETLGGMSFIELLIEQTHTCYQGERGQRHAWGYGCGDCPACQLRARGFMQWQTESASG